MKNKKERTKCKHYYFHSLRLHLSILEITIERSGKNYEKITKEMGDEKIISSCMYFHAFSCGMCHSSTWCGQDRICAKVIFISMGITSTSCGDCTCFDYKRSIQFIVYWNFSGSSVVRAVECGKNGYACIQ